MTMTIAPTKSYQVQLCNETYFGLAVFRLDGKEFAAGTLEECEMAARQVAKECFDLIPTELIMEHSWLPPEAIDLVRYVQEDYTDRAARLFTQLVTDLDVLAEKAVAAKGRVHYLSLWDEPVEYTLVDFPGLDTTPIHKKLGLAPDHKGRVYLYPVQ